MQRKVISSDLWGSENRLQGSERGKESEQMDSVNLDQAMIFVSRQLAPE